MTDFEKTVDEVFSASLPYESWEQITGESSKAFSAFCVFRDFGAERNIRKAVESYEKDKSKFEKRYRVWRNWSTQFRWKERAADYDRYLEKLKQTELRKIIEAQTEKQIEVAGLMLNVLGKKLTTMNPDDLTQNNVPEWLLASTKVQREISGLTVDNEKSDLQGQFNFEPELKGL